MCKNRSEIPASIYKSPSNRWEIMPLYFEPKWRIKWSIANQVFKWCKEHDHLQMLLPRISPAQKMQPSLVPGDSESLLWWGVVVWLSPLQCLLSAKLNIRLNYAGTRTVFSSSSAARWEMYNIETCTALCRFTSTQTFMGHFICLAPVLKSWAPLPMSQACHK